jgi:hypothetical protein
LHHGVLVILPTNKSPLQSQCIRLLDGAP